jgi:hypothetical protein
VWNDGGGGSKCGVRRTGQLLLLATLSCQHDLAGYHARANASRGDASGEEAPGIDLPTTSDGGTPDRAPEAVSLPDAGAEASMGLWLCDGRVDLLAGRVWFHQKPRESDYGEVPYVLGTVVEPSTPTVDRADQIVTRLIQAPIDPPSITVCAEYEIMAGAGGAHVELTVEEPRQGTAWTKIADPDRVYSPSAPCQIHPVGASHREFQVGLKVWTKDVRYSLRRIALCR